MTVSKKLLFSGLVAIIIGAVGVLPALYFSQPQKSAAGYSPETTITLPAQTITGKPIRVLVPSLGIDLNVADGFYNYQTQQWTLSNRSAYFATLSVQPNDAQGNTLVYGHAIPQIFGLLKGLNPGDKAILQLDNGYKFTYEYHSTIAVSPSNSEVFDANGAPRLTLQTCSGSWSQNRQLYSFELISTDKEA